MADPGQSPLEIAELLKAESDRLLHIDPREALSVAERIGDLDPGACNTPVRALGQLAEADALRQLGRYGDALTAYEHAAAAYTELDDEVGWARTRVGAALTWRYTGATSSNLADIETR